MGGGDGGEVGEVCDEVRGQVGDVGRVENHAVYRCREEGRRGVDREVRYDILVRDRARFPRSRGRVRRGERTKEPEWDISCADIYEERGDHRRGPDTVEGA